MANKAQTNSHSYFFVVAYPSTLAKDVDVIIDMKHQGVQPLQKLLEKNFKAADGHQDYTAKVYSGDLMAHLIKDKEILINKNKQRMFHIKIALKVQKNKFTSNIDYLLDYDSFINFINFETIKKIIGKDIEPPQQIKLTPFQYLSLFSEALIQKKGYKLNDPTYIQFLNYGMQIINSLGIVPLNLFILIYEKILKSENVHLLKMILDFFQIKKIEIPKNLQELNLIHESVMLIYDNQKKYIENILKIKDTNFLFYLIKFYTSIIFYFSVKNDYQTVEDIMLDLRDKNPYDNLILSKLFLSEYNYFYRSLPINQEIKMSLIDSFILASISYDDLLTSFSMIKEYINGDFNTMLLILIKNYDRIYEICLNGNKSLKMNNYINQRNDDNLSQIQNSLGILGQLKLNCGYKALDFNINTWDIYLNNTFNPEFFEFLKSHLIQSSLDLNEVNEALGYISFYTRKNMATMMELFVKNYDKLETISKNEIKSINAFDYIVPNENDNIDAIKEYLDYIITRKLKANYETIFFKIDIWLFYINNKFNQEFLSYIENKLLEGVLYFEDIVEIMKYASVLRMKKLDLILKFVIQHFDKITMYALKKKATLDISKLIIQNKDSDNLEEIYKLICETIDKEKYKKYKPFHFPINIWEPYSQIQDLDCLRLIRKIIIKLSEMDSTLDENCIGLSQKIHKVGFQYIRNGNLVGERLLEFLGNEEGFFIEDEIKGINETNEFQQAQINVNSNNFNNLQMQTKILAEKIEMCTSEIVSLKEENRSLKSRIYGLEIENTKLKQKVQNSENEINKLKGKVNYY